MTSHLNLGDANTELRRSRIATALSAHWDELAAPTKGEKFSIMRMIDAMANQKFNRRDSYEGALCDAAARANMSEFDPQRAIVPWGVFADRNLTVSTPSAGGNLVGAQVGDVLDVLRPFSVLANMGVRTVEPGAEDLMVPNVTHAATGQWLASEESSLDAGNPVIGVHSSAPKTAGALLKASFLFMRQARQGEAFIRRQLLGAMAETLDKAILQGTGSEGQPIGLKYAPGVWEIESVTAGTAPGSEDIHAMEAAAGVMGAYDLKWIAHPSLRKLLRSTYTTISSAYVSEGSLYSGALGIGRPIWHDKKILDDPAYVSTHCPPYDLFVGDWSLCNVAFWNGGMQIEVDPYTSFQSGVVQVRVLMNCDVYFEKPGAFVRRLYVPEEE